MTVPDMPLFEQILIYLGQLSMIGASIYMVFKGDKKIGFLFLLALIFQIQSSYVAMSHMRSDDLYKCAAQKMVSFNDCMPLYYKLSSYLGMFGVILMGVGIYLCARRLSAENI